MVVYWWLAGVGDFVVFGTKMLMEKTRNWHTLTSKMPLLKIKRDNLKFNLTINAYNAFIRLSDTSELMLLKFSFSNPRNTWK